MRGSPGELRRTSTAEGQVHIRQHSHLGKYPFTPHFDPKQFQVISFSFLLSSFAHPGGPFHSSACNVSLNALGISRFSVLFILNGLLTRRGSTRMVHVRLKSGYKPPRSARCNSGKRGAGKSYERSHVSGSLIVFISALGCRC